MRHAFVKRVLARFIADFEHNPEVQFAFHKWAMYFWAANAIVWTLCFLCFQAIWVQVGLFVTLMLSLYANWDTDFDAMSASGAWIEAKRVNAKVDDTNTTQGVTRP